MVCPNPGTLLDDVDRRDAAQHLLRTVVVLRLDPIQAVECAHPAAVFSDCAAQVRAAEAESCAGPCCTSGTDMNSRHSSPVR